MKKNVKKKLERIKREISELKILQDREGQALVKSLIRYRDRIKQLRAALTHPLPENHVSEIKNEILMIKKVKVRTAYYLYNKNMPSITKQKALRNLEKEQLEKILKEEDK